MDNINHHQFKELFDQLGLESTEDAINQFIENNALSDQEKLENAHFLNKNQKKFIKDELENDSDWCEIIDELNAALH